MPSIGVIDDRVDIRSIVVDALSLAPSLAESWEVVPSDPLPHLEDYPSWIGEYKISVLIIDERLNESASPSSEAVSYYGHDLVKYLRKRMENFPIFVVTSYPNDLELRKRFGDVEDIIDRTDFMKDANSYATRFARSSQRYLETFERELSELSQIALKAAVGEDITEDERTRVQAIQQKINMTFSFDSIENRSQWIAQMEATVHDFDVLKQELEELLARSSSDEVEEDT